LRRSGGNPHGPSQGSFQLIRLKAEGPRFALVSNAPLRIDQVKTIGPAGVGALGGIIERIHDCRKLDAELQDAELADGAALVETFRAREENVIVEIV
jgi:hypothetical protein